MFTITCVGGDIRQLYLAQILIEAGHSVRLVGICEEDCQKTFHKHHAPCFCHQISYFSVQQLSEAIDGSNLVLGPIPLCRPHHEIHSDFPDFHITIRQLLNALTPSQYLIAGMIPKEVECELAQRNIYYYDYIKNASFAKLNAIATAEGAISYAIEHSTNNLHLSNVLVLGYGVCGSLIASKCQSLNAHVTVTGRREEIKATAISNGFSYIDTIDLKQPLLSNTQYVFNTIPNLVLTSDRLKHLPADCTIVDIASAPGGTDFEFAREHHLNATLYLGIPGKIAPKASAKILYQIIIGSLKERSPLYVPQYN